MYNVNCYVYYVCIYMMYKCVHYEMFINVASTHNPITGEVNPGCDDSPIENHKTGRRHVAITSSESGVLHYIRYCNLNNMNNSTERCFKTYR